VAEFKPDEAKPGRISNTDDDDACRRALLPRAHPGQDDDTRNRTGRDKGRVVWLF
jgi:hypothetical protein